MIEGKETGRKGQRRRERGRGLNISRERKESEDEVGGKMETDR